MIHGHISSSYKCEAMRRFSGVLRVRNGDCSIGKSILHKPAPHETYVEFYDYLWGHSPTDILHLKKSCRTENRSAVQNEKRFFLAVELMESRIRCAVHFVRVHLEQIFFEMPVKRDEMLRQALSKSDTQPTVVSRKNTWYIPLSMERIPVDTTSSSVHLYVSSIHIQANCSKLIHWISSTR